MANLPETPQWEEGIYQIEISDPVLGGPDGISNRQAKQLAKRTSYLKQRIEKNDTAFSVHILADDPHPQYAVKASPVFVGTPSAPTPPIDDNSCQLATTEYVFNALASLMADVLGNDRNFATTVLNKLAGKLDKEQNGADISDKAAFLNNLGLGAGSALPIGVPIPYPLVMPPPGWLKCNGAPFDKNHYPGLAMAYPSGVLPDLRGEFIRGWDDGRGVDAYRVIQSFQESTLIANANGDFTHYTGQDIKNSDGIAATFVDYTRYDLVKQPLGQGADYLRLRPRNIAFSYIVRAA